MSSRRSIVKINGRPMLMHRAVFSALAPAPAAADHESAAPVTFSTPMPTGPPFEVEAPGNSSLVEKEMLRIREKLFKK